MTDAHEALAEWGHRAEHAVEAVRELTAHHGFGPNYNMLAGSTTLKSGLLCMCAIERARKAGLIEPQGPGFGGCREGGYVEVFRCICPVDSAVGRVTRAVDGCPAHKARFAAQQHVEQAEAQ